MHLEDQLYGCLFCDKITNLHSLMIELVIILKCHLGRDYVRFRNVCQKEDYSAITTNFVVSIRKHFCSYTLTIIYKNRKIIVIDNGCYSLYIMPDHLSYMHEKFRNDLSSFDSGLSYTGTKIDIARNTNLELGIRQLLEITNTKSARN